MPKLDKRLPDLYGPGADPPLFDWAEARAGGDDSPPTRDLAILELFYSTGIRLSELSGMNLEDLDLLSDQAKVRGQGPEGADRAGRLAGGARPPPLS